MTSNNKRYYPQPAEQAILAQNIKLYFTYPERSSERSKLAAEVANSLIAHSPHWTHRAVRLWFNNNRNVYSANIEPQTPPRQQVRFAIQTINYPGIQPGPNMQMNQFDPSFMNQNIQHQPKPIEIPVMSIMAPPVINRPSVPVNRNYMEELKRSLSDTKKAGGVMNPQQMIEFEKTVNEMNSSGIRASIPFPDNPEGHLEFPVPTMDPNADYADFNEEMRPEFSVWSTRDCNRLATGSFDVSYNGKGGMAYIHATKLSAERVLEIAPQSLERKKVKWTSINLQNSNRMEGITIDEDHSTAWINSGTTFLRVKLDESHKVDSFELKIRDTPAPNSMASVKKSLLIASTTSKDFHMISEKGKITQIVPSVQHGEGYSHMNYFTDKILAAPISTCAFYLLDDTGREIRSFYGHTDTISNSGILKDGLYVTASEDRCIKLWDIRQNIPVSSITCDRRSITGMSCSENNIIFGIHDRMVCIVDIKGTRPNPFLGLATDDYSVVCPYYNTNANALSFFGIASQNGNSDSTFFIDDAGGSVKYEYREYSPILLR